MHKQSMESCRRCSPTVKDLICSCWITKTKFMWCQSSMWLYSAPQQTLHPRRYVEARGNPLLAQRQLPFRRWQDRVCVAPFHADSMWMQCCELSRLSNSTSQAQYIRFCHAPSLVIWYRQPCCCRKGLSIRTQISSRCLIFDPFTSKSANSAVG